MNERSPWGLHVDPSVSKGQHGAPKVFRFWNTVSFGCNFRQERMFLTPPEAPVLTAWMWCLMCSLVAKESELCSLWSLFCTLTLSRRSQSMVVSKKYAWLNFYFKLCSGFRHFCRKNFRWTVTRKAFDPNWRARKTLKIFVLLTLYRT